MEVIIMKKIMGKIIVSAIVCVMAGSLLLTGCSDSGQGGSIDAYGNFVPFQNSLSSTANTPDSPQNGSSVGTPPAAVPAGTVRMADWNQVEWEQYNGTYFTMMIPKGWQVDVSGTTCQMSWSAHNPNSTVGISARDHAIYAAKDPQMTQALGLSMYLTSGTVQEFYQTFFADSTESFTVHSSCVPADLAKIQSVMAAQVVDYQSLYATFRQNGFDGEGVYSALVTTGNDVMIRGVNYGSWGISCIFSEWAPVGELVSWKPILSQMAQSFQYTDQYMQEYQYLMGVISSRSSVDNNDVVMQAFEERSESDTIIPEKRSDMIGEYERVYDNETGQIYRAYNGFLDDLGTGNTRYTPITDKQYTEGYVGWIDKD